MIEIDGDKQPAAANPIKEGDTVEVIRPDVYTSVFSKKVRDRKAIVERIYTRLGSREATAILRFLLRNGRGKEFVEHMPLRDVRLVEAKEQA